MAGKKSSGSDKPKRYRNWAFIVYPDSAPENWREILDDYKVQWVESPLHDQDVNPDGSVKKPHWHCLFIFDGVKSFDQIVELLKPLNCPIPVKCNSVKGDVRYMAHLDNPEKHQYSAFEIKTHGGLDLSDLLQPTRTERYILIGEMCDFIKAQGIVEFQDLVDVARQERFEDWFPLLCDNSAYIIERYIASARNRAKVTVPPGSKKSDNTSDEV